MITKEIIMITIQAATEYYQKIKRRSEDTLRANEEKER